MKGKLIYGIVETLYRLKIFKMIFLLRNLFHKRLTILMFHRVCNGKEVGLPTISIEKGNFERLIDLLQEYYYIASLDEIEEILQIGKSLPKIPIMLTFDDAYEGAYKHAFEILIKRSLPATIFPVINAIKGKTIFWWDAVYGFLFYANPKTPVATRFYSLLSDELKERLDYILQIPRDAREYHINRFIEGLKEFNIEKLHEIAGHLSRSYQLFLRKKNGNLARSMSLEFLLELESKGFSIGSHTVSHQFLRNLSNEHIYMELINSKEELERMIGKQVISFAYPSGIYSGEVVQMVKDAEYSMAFTTKSGINTSSISSFELKRINIWDQFVCDRNGEFSASLTLWRLLATS